MLKRNLKVKNEHTNTKEGVEMKDEKIRYFSMFTGVGGFELGIESASNRNVKYSNQKENLPNFERDKSISERQQEGINNSTNNGEIEYTQDTSGTLFQNRQEQSNSFSENLESIKGDIKFGQQIRQTSIGILREGNGIRDDSESMEFREDSSNSKQFQCVGFSEIDKYANQLLAKRFPNITNFGDCTKIEADKLPDFDMLCGGFPCQSFSIAGKRRGFQDTRGTMFFHIARILEVKRPKIVFLENVKGLLNHDKGETFRVIIQTLSELGYDVQWMVLNSKFFGVPQNRERVFIIGSLRGTSKPEILPFGGSYEEVNGKVLGTLETNGWEKRHEQIRRVWDTSGTAPTIPTAQGGGVMTKIAINSATKNGYSEAEIGDGIRLEYPESKTARGRVIKGNANTLKKGTEGVIDNSFKIRRLTPTECERLQGFPDGWTEGFSDTQRYKMMGNAVTTNVISAIASKLFAKGVNDKQIRDSVKGKEV